MPSARRWVNMLLISAAKMECIMDENKEFYVLPEEVARDWHMFCQAFVQINTQPGQLYHPKKVMLFHMTIKFHDILHLAMLAKGVSALEWGGATLE